MKLELRSVRIKNCGPIDDIKIDFFDASGKTLPVCVIGGANGSGKTTMIEAIVSLANVLEGDDPGAFLNSKHQYYVQADWLIDGVEFSLFRGVLPPDAILKKEYYGMQLTRNLERKSGPFYMGERKSTLFYTRLRQRISEQQDNLALRQLSENSFPADTYVPSILYLPHRRGLEVSRSP